MTSLAPVTTEIKHQSPTEAHSTKTLDERPGHIVFKKVHVPLSYPPPPGALKLQSDIITVFPPPKPVDSQLSPTLASPPATPSYHEGGSAPSTPLSATARRSFEALEQQHRTGGAVPSIQRNNTISSATTTATAAPGGGGATSAPIPIRRRLSTRAGAGFAPGRMASMPNLTSSTHGPFSVSLPNLPTVLSTSFEEQGLEQEEAQEQEQEQGEKPMHPTMAACNNVSTPSSPLTSSSTATRRPSDLKIQDRRASVSSIVALHHQINNKSAMTATAVTDNNTQSLPSPPDSPWIKTRRPSVNGRLNRAATMFVASTSPPAVAVGQHSLPEEDIPYPDLPTNVRSWTSSHVATYLCYILRFYPRAITEDLARYVRQTACLNGEEFLDLQDEDLARMGINQKWRQLIMEGVRALRRETLRMTRSLDGMRWEDGFDPHKDKVLPSLSGNVPQDGHVRELSSTERRQLSCDEQDFIEEHARIASYHERQVEPGEDEDSDDADEVDLDEFQKELDDHQYHRYHDADDDLGFGHRLQGLKKSFMSSVTSLTSMFPDQQQQLPVKTVIDGDESTLLERIGFVEGVLVGGIAVACIMRFVR